MQWYKGVLQEKPLRGRSYFGMVEKDRMLAILGEEKSASRFLFMWGEKRREKEPELPPFTVDQTLHGSSP